MHASAGARLSFIVFLLGPHIVEEIVNILGQQPQLSSLLCSSVVPGLVGICAWVYIFLRRFARSSDICLKTRIEEMKKIKCGKCENSWNCKIFGIL